MLVVRVLVVPISDRKMHIRRLNTIVIVKCHSVSSCSTIVLYSQYICGPAALFCSMLGPSCSQDFRVLWCCPT